MAIGTLARRASCLVFLFCCLSGTAGEFATAATFDQSPAGQEALQVGVQLERSRQWLDAIEHYEKAIESWPDSKELQYGLRRSKIHFSIARRYEDRSFQEQLLPQSRYEALALLDDVLTQIRSNYVEQISTTSLIAHGTESLYLALANDEFLQQNLAGVNPQRIEQLRTVLREKYWNAPVADRVAARQTVGTVCDTAHSVLGLAPGAVVLEYVFGCCNALDDYSGYLTADRLEDLYGNIEGEFVGLGIEMKAEPGKGMLLVNILPESPAAEGGMHRGEFIVEIADADCRNMSTDEAARLLRGPVGSQIRLTLEDANTAAQRQQVFVRRPVHVKSIPVAEIIDPQRGVGYIQMTGFQKSSAEELDAAMAKLHRRGLRALIWDLRGNPGGLLTASVEVLDRFIGSGVLVSTRGRTYDQNWTYSAHQAGTLSIPLVLLVDENSASASEIVAGAIRDHNRGTVVGRKTYGKWSVQSIFPVRGGTGLRLTTAKFYAPKGETLGKIGVQPNVLVDLAQTQTTFYHALDATELQNDPDVQRGLEVLRTQLTRR